MSLTRAVIDGALLSTAASVLIFASLRANPRIWLNDFPPDLRAAVPPKTPTEHRQSLVWGVPFMALLLGWPIVSTVLVASSGASAAFPSLWLHAFVVVLVFNLVDLLLVDWLVLCTFTPRAFVLPGTEGMPGYQDYSHHFRGFLIGMVVSAVLATIAATVATQFAT